MASNPVFATKQKKTFKIQFTSTDSNKKRVESIQRELEQIDPEMVFDINSLLERSLEEHLDKAEKEIKKLKSENKKSQQERPSLS
ncbi:hypothetical protein [Pseudoalteromonas galatheae]|uniref:hypothetical protein n=1 Tax=Pseudoalteromonas galatheae TaxID=579562 RepID=UPI0030D407B2